MRILQELSLKWMLNSCDKHVNCILGDEVLFRWDCLAQCKMHACTATTSQQLAGTPLHGCVSRSPEVVLAHVCAFEAHLGDPFAC